MERNVKLLCIRHGESEGNLHKVFCATPDVPLTPYGRQQARLTGFYLRADFSPGRIVSSPYRRALETAEIIGEVLQLPVEVEEDLRERDIGEYAGCPYEVVLDDPNYGKDAHWRWRPPGGESLADVAERAVPAACRIAANSTAAEIVVVSHAGVIAALCAAARGNNWDGVSGPLNAEVLVLEYADGRLHLRE